MKSLAALLLLVGGFTFANTVQAQTPDSTTHRKIERYQAKKRNAVGTTVNGKETPAEKKTNDSIPPVHPKQTGSKETPQKATPASK